MNCENALLLIINPGSTSTKISVFRGRKCLFTESVFHDAPQLLAFPTVNDQVPFRTAVTLKLLAAHGIDITDIDAIAGRGGCACSQPEGVMLIDRKLAEDTAADKGGSDHAAKLGVLTAWRLGTEFHKPMYTMNPTNLDELCDCARVTGIAGLYRRAQSHALNQKAVARLHAEKIGRRYEDCNFIVSHIDGGITVSAHARGKMIDGTEGAGGDGPFTPTRIGSIPVIELLNYLETHTIAEVRAMCSRSGGLVSHFGTSDSDAVHHRVEQGDPKAALIWQAMIYQTGKAIGAMATVLCGRVDGILLTGGLLRFDDIVSGIRERCGFIAPIFSYPGELEQETLAAGVSDVLSGKAAVRRYTGTPVFSGFDWDR
ncbi:MAG: butyrate kinase [Victivallaceae bacterium]|nr:butyrate kinase [Victivallaceae bacterium]